MCSHKKAHCDDFQDHLHGINQEEDEINGGVVFGNTINLLVQGQEDAVNHNDEQDKSIEPRVNSDQLNDLVPEWIGNREAAERNSGVVLLLISCSGNVIVIRVSGHCLLHRFHRLNSELSKSETSNLLQQLKIYHGYLHSTFLSSAVSFFGDQTLFS